MKRKCYTLGKRNEFYWTINNKCLKIEREFKNLETPREDEYTKVEILEIINFIKKCGVVGLNNSVSKINDAKDSITLYDDYYLKGLGYFVYNYSSNITKAQSTSQLVAILTENKIIEKVKSRPLSFSIAKDAFENIELLFK